MGQEQRVNPEKARSLSTAVLIPGDYGLAGLLEWPAAGAIQGGLVVAHPHPLYGGSMVQPVVHRVAESARMRGFVTLRFNFRGVGQSTGSYDGQAEYRDVEAAARFLAARLADEVEDSQEKPLPMALAGYSFGSLMAAAAAGGEVPVAALVLIALVVNWEELPSFVWERLKVFRGPVLAVCGEADELAPPVEVEDLLASLGLDFRLTVVEGADHLFMGRQKEVGERVADFLAEAMGESSRED